MSVALSVALFVIAAWALVSAAPLIGSILRSRVVEGPSSRPLVVNVEPSRPFTAEELRVALGKVPPVCELFAPGVVDASERETLPAPEPDDEVDQFSNGRWPRTSRRHYHDAEDVCAHTEARWLGGDLPPADHARVSKAIAKRQRRAVALARQVRS